MAVYDMRVPWTNPRAWVAREQAASDRFNEQLRDNMRCLRTSAWVNATLGSSWVTYGAPWAIPSAKAQAGVVTLRGLIRNGTGSAGTIIGTWNDGVIPPPTSTLYFSALDASGTTVNLNVGPSVPGSEVVYDSPWALAVADGGIANNGYLSINFSYPIELLPPAGA